MMSVSIEEGSGTLTPTLSTASTAIESQTNSLFSSPQKSPVLNGNTSSSSALAVPRSRRNSTRKRSFSSANKLPKLEPSSSHLRRHFDLLLLWIMRTVMSFFLSVIALKNQVIYAVWGLWYNWHASAWWAKLMIERDIAGMRLPRHVSVILDQRKMRGEYDAQESVRRVTELAMWCACAGISILTIYEPTGLLKKDVKKIQHMVQKSTTLHLHRKTPFKVDVSTPQSALLNQRNIHDKRDMEILVISQEDSRLPIVDLARTLGDMAKHEKLFPEDVSIDLIHENLTENLMTEPDLLILFSPKVDLQGFPPWQIRLTEIFHLPDNVNFGYSVFLWALRMYNRAEMRLGR